MLLQTILEGLWLGALLVAVCERALSAWCICMAKRCRSDASHWG